MERVHKHDHAFKIELAAYAATGEIRPRLKEEGALRVSVGQELRLCVKYTNTDSQWRLHENVKIIVELPEQLEYVPSSTVMTDGIFSDNKPMEDGIAGEGIEIGSYTPGTWAAVCLRVRAVAKGMRMSEVATMPWARGEVKCAAMQDFSQTTVIVRKA